MSTGPYTCPGRDMPQPPDAPTVVACYRAGHQCPPKEPIRTERDGALSVRFRCPCCGDGGSQFCVPAAMRGKRTGGLS